MIYIAVMGQQAAVSRRIPEESAEAHQPRRDFTRAVHHIIDMLWPIEWKFVRYKVSWASQ